MESVKRYLPDNKNIKQLEKISQKEGSGINYEDLLGIWILQSVWKKSSDERDNVTSSILQVLSAKLELKKKQPDAYRNFEIKNSIKFGILSITFFGIASLKGTRPILFFYFEKLKVNFANTPIINKKLKKPQENNMPFFSLIGICNVNNWRAARGRGGGLALWVKY